MLDSDMAITYHYLRKLKVKEHKPPLVLPAPENEGASSSVPPREEPKWLKKFVKAKPIKRRGAVIQPKDLATAVEAESSPVVKEPVVTSGDNLKDDTAMDPPSREDVNPERAQVEEQVQKANVDAILGDILKDVDEGTSSRPMPLEVPVLNDMPVVAAPEKAAITGDKFASAPLDTSTELPLTGVELGFSDLHHLILQRYESEMKSAADDVDAERLRTADAQEKNQQLCADINDLKKEIRSQEELKDEYRLKAEAAHSGCIPRDEAHKVLEDKDAEIAKAAEMLGEAQSKRDAALQAAIDIQKERDAANEEVDNLKLQLKKLSDEKTELLRNAVEKTKELKERTLALEALQEEHTQLSELIAKHCEAFFGDNEDLKGFSPEQCLRMLASKIMSTAGDCYAVVKLLSPNERVPASIDAILETLRQLQDVVEWLKRSSCRRGITAALSLVASHYGEDFELPVVTDGYPSTSSDGTVLSDAQMDAEATKQMAKCAPYADRVLEMVKLSENQTSQVAPEDMKNSPPKQRDEAARRLFAGFS
ncbi:hypothetical protein ACQ4PT_049883 [Festuca glaucescens]